MREELTECYEILELEPGASAEEVKSAYTDLVKVWHPDRYQRESPRLQLKAEEKLKAINAAYERLRTGRGSGNIRPQPKPRPEPAAPPPPPPSPYEDPRSLRPARMGERWGYLDATGRVAIRAEYDEADYFYEGVARVAVPTRAGKLKSGYINGRGEYVIAPQFMDAKRFSEGLAAAVISVKWGFVDTEGTLKIHPEFEAVSDFRDGSAAVKQRGKWGVIDREGCYLAPPRFDGAEPFDGPWARIRLGDRKGRINREGHIFLDDIPREVS